MLKYSQRGNKVFVPKDDINNQCKVCAFVVVLSMVVTTLCRSKNFFILRFGASKSPQINIL